MNYDLFFLRLMIAVTFALGVVMIVLSFCTSCTYSVNLVHTEGEADDVIDETQRADPDIKADLTIPAI